MSQADERENRFNDIILAYFQEIEAGRTPNADDWKRRHPEFAADMDRFLAQEADLGRQFEPRNEGAAPDGATPTLRVGFGPAFVVDPAESRSFGDFQLLEILGQGGMGIVWKARHVPLNRLVAVKMVRGGAEASREDLMRFRSEATAAAQLDHPNIVPIYEVGEIQGRAYFSMKYVEGESLAQWIARSDPGSARLPPRVAANWMAQIARAIHHAHERGILHRDIKPGNILLGGMRDEGGGMRKDRGAQDDGFLPHPKSHIQHPFVTDFGLAKRLELDSDLTQTGVIVGTPSYMAPEQAAGGKDLGPAADVYSLGAVLYHLLAGRRPFQGSTPMETLVQVQTQDVDRPSSVNRRVDRVLETICLKCLEKGPRLRYASALELAEDLERFLAHEPIRARSLPMWRRLYRRALRRPVMAALMLAVPASAVLIASVTWWLTRPPAVSIDQAERTKDLERYARLLRLAHTTQDRTAAEQALLDCPKDLRGWEWQYVARRVRRLPINLQLRASDHASQALLNQDGSMLAVLGEKARRIYLWNGFTGAPIRTLEWEERIECLALSPDGKQLAVAEAGQSQVRLLDLSTGSESRPLAGADAPVKSMDFSAHGHLATGHADGRVRIWNLADGQATSLPGSQRDPVIRVLFGANNSLLVAASTKQIDLWRVGDARKVRTLSGTFKIPHRASMYIDSRNMALSPDGSMLATAFASIDVWQVGDGLRVHTFDIPNESHFVAFDPASNRLITLDGALPRSILYFDPVKGTEVMKVPFTTPGDGMFSRLTGSGAFSGDAKRLVTMGLQNNVLIVDLDAQRGEQSLPGSIPAAVTSTGHRIAACADRTGIDVWDLPSLKKAKTLPATSINDICWSGNGRYLVWVSAGGLVNLWDSASDTQRPEFQADLARFVRFNSATDLVVAGDGGRLAFWNRTQRKVAGDVMAHQGGVTALAISAEDLIASGGADGHVRLWQSSHPNPLCTLSHHDGAITSLAFSPDGKLLATGGSDQAVCVWDAKQGRLLHCLRGHEGPMSALCFTADGDRLLTADAAKTIRVWEVQWGVEVFRSVNEQAVEGMAMGPENRLITIGADKTIRIR